MSDTQLHNFPPQPTSFIGRTSEITEIVGLLNNADCRLLSLVGPGGIGKTRLAIESISRLTHKAFIHGIFYVPLAPLSSADNIVTTVISVLGILIGDDGTPQEELVNFLSQRNLLLVMDNFEHVLGGADLVVDILNMTQNVQILVTSREVLNLRMERVWHVRGMHYPRSENIENIDQYSAIELFVNRATWVRHDFSPQEQKEYSIRICQLIEGMPLAIELAASWLKTLSCRDIVKQIQHGIDFLSTRARDIPERHRSMRAVFDHSWKLLTHEEQELFPRLAVFRGGFTLEAAENVAGANLTTLSGLVEKSMIRRDSSGRYDIHELLRQYASEKLNIVGETDEMLSAYTTYFAEFMAEHAIDIKGRRQLEGLNEIEFDFDNVIEVWNRAIIDKDYESLDYMMEGLALFCETRAQYQIGEDLFNLALRELAPLHHSSIHPVYNRLRARYIQVWLLPSRYPIPDRIRQLVDDCLRIAEEQEDIMTIMLCHWSQCEFKRIKREVVRYSNEEHEKALIAYDIPLQLARQLEAQYYEGRVLRGMDHMCTFQIFDTSAQAREISRQAREITRHISDFDGYTHLLFYQSNRARLQGNHDKKLEYLLEAMSRWEMIKDTKSIGIVKSILGWWYFEQGDFTTAEHFFIEAEHILTSVNYLVSHQSIYSGLSRLKSIRGHYEEGYRLAQITYLYSLSWFHIDMTYYFIGVSDFDNAQHHLESALIDRQPYPCSPIVVILIAFLFNHDHQHVRAVELLSLAWHHPRDINDWMEKWDLLTQLKADLEAKLGIEIYNAAWEQGAQLDLEETVTEWLDYFDNEKSNTSVPLSQPLIDPLTPRELEVLELLVDGLSNREIAVELTVTVGTVKTHTYNIRQKLDVKKNIQAVIRAKQLRLL